MARPQQQEIPKPKPEPELRLWTIRREGSVFRIVTAIIQGDRVLALDESDGDARTAQVGRIEGELARIP